MTNNNNDDDTMRIPTLRGRVVDNLEEETEVVEELLDGLNSLSEPERAWLRWFNSLSEEDKRIVELCGEKGVSVTAANFDQMKAIVVSYMVDGEGSKE